ncbi:MAG: ABC transporter permease [Gemmatimonadota bacterium]|nr:ABC transporter permease [Gemmatimonadota bacterium]
MERFLRDFRYGVRTLAKSPGLTIVATIALTLGIGLTTTMFSITYGAIMRGLPYADGDRIVQVRRDQPERGNRRMNMPVAEYEEFRTLQHSFDAFAAWYSGTVNVSGTGDAERYTGSFVTASAFDLPRVRPLHGRTILPGEDVANGPRVAVIGYTMFQRRFGGDSAVVGTVVRANGQPYTIVGVMPEEFRFPDDAAIWLPLQLNRTPALRTDGTWVTVAGRLRDGTTLAQATAELRDISARFAAEYKTTNEGITAYAMSFVDAEIGPQPRQLLFTMLGAVFFVLLIACANVANLLLDRAAHRTKEVGIRTALGASRAAVVRQFLAEALVLTAVGTVLGTALAQAGITLFNRAIVDTQPPFFIDIRLHPPVLLFTVGVALLATLLSGLIPAIQSSRTDINEVLKDETRGSSSLRIGRMSKALVVFEIALSCGLLVASGLMIKSVTKLNAMDPGFRLANIFTSRIGFPAGYTDTTMQRQFFADLRGRLAGIPGARSAAIASGLPGVNVGGGNFTVDGATYGQEKDVPNARWQAVSAGYFETFDVPVHQGRAIVESDRLDTEPVAVVNEAFVRKFFGGKDALGRRIRQGGLASKAPWMTVVGVVPDAYSGNQSEPKQAAYYVPLTQNHSNFVSLAVRTDGDPLAITSQVREAVKTLNPDIPMYWVYSMQEAFERPTWFIRVFGTMFMIFGVIALFLASIGLYAVMSFSVSRRVREVGIRMALGAQGRDVVGMMFRQGLVQVTVGMVLGLGLAAGVAQLMDVILFQVNPRDPAIFAGVVVVLAVVALVACLVPARRATRIDPLVALRAD